MAVAADQKAVEIEDRAANEVTITTGYVTLTFPAQVSGKARDFLLYVDATGVVGYPAGLSVEIPSGYTLYGSFPNIDCEKPSVYFVFVTEITSGKFVVRYAKFT